MGLLSKAWKGLKKTVKKIGKGVKKVFKKIGSAIGKLGIVGQIGMMFLMPYAMGALGSFFGAAGKLATWSTKLLNAGGFGAKALGHTLNLINKAGTFVGNAYNSVSTTISNAVDKTGNFLKGRGFKLSEDIAAEAFIQEKGLSIDYDAMKKQGLKLDVEGSKAFEKAIAEASAAPKISLETINKSLGLEVPKVDKVGELLDLGTKNYDDMLKFDPTKINVDTGNILEGMEIPKVDTSILSKPKDMFPTLVDTAQDYIEGELKSGAKAFAKQETLKAFGVEQSGGDYNAYTFNLPGVIDRGSINNSVYGEVDFALQKTGNNYLVNNIQNSNYLNSLIDDSNTYRQFMAQNAGAMYTFV
tara:strand:+ start:1051 stop:2121 length:1071 start_codon:yes stop_codon:yes gene_type:complete